MNCNKIIKPHRFVCVIGMLVHISASAWLSAELVSLKIRKIGFENGIQISGDRASLNCKIEYSIDRRNLIEECSLGKHDGYTFLSSIELQGTFQVHLKTGKSLQRDVKFSFLALIESQSVITENASENCTGRLVPGKEESHTVLSSKPENGKFPLQLSFDVFASGDAKIEEIARSIARNEIHRMKIIFIELSCNWKFEMEYPECRRDGCIVVPIKKSYKFKPSRIRNLTVVQ
jgi:hypothetical protein